MSARWWLFIPAAMLVLAFQNCGGGRSTDYEAPSASDAPNDDADFLAYPYQTAPDFYGDVQVFRGAGAGDLSSIKFHGAASIADPTLTGALQWETRIADDAGVVCPTRTGSLAAGASAIEFDCVTSRSVSKLTVTLTVKSGAKSAVFKRVYTD